MAIRHQPHPQILSMAIFLYASVYHERHTRDPAYVKRQLEIVSNPLVIVSTLLTASVSIVL